MGLVKKILGEVGDYFLGIKYIKYKRDKRRLIETDEYIRKIYPSTPPEHYPSSKEYERKINTAFEWTILLLFKAIPIIQDTCGLVSLLKGNDSQWFELPIFAEFFRSIGYIGTLLQRRDFYKENSEMLEDLRKN